MGRPDLAQVVDRGPFALGKIDPDAAQERHRDDVDLLDDPGHRQDRDILVGRLARVGAQVGCAVLEKRAVLQHRELGLGGRARGGAEHRDLLALALRHRLGEPLGREALAALDQLRAREQPLVPIFAHAARIVVDDPAQLRQLAGDLQQLVGLLLVLGEGQPRAGVVQQVGDLRAEGILIDAERHRADAVRRQLRPQPVRPVAADDRDHVAALDAQRQQAQRQRLHAIARIRPAVAVPDAVLLLPQGHFGAPMGGVVEQELRRGVERREIGQLHGRAARRARRRLRVAVLNTGRCTPPMLPCRLRLCCEPSQSPPRLMPLYTAAGGDARPPPPRKPLCGAGAGLRDPGRRSCAVPNFGLR